MLLGIVGTLGAGKGTVVSYLKEKGFAHYSASGVLREIIESEGGVPNRDTYTIMGDKLRELNPAGPIAILYDRSIENKDTMAIIESIHDVPEAEFLKRNGALLLGVDADLEIRYKRIKKRGSEKDNVTFEDFKKIALHEENGGGKHHIREVLHMADYTITNNGTLEELHAQVEAVLQQIGF